MWLKDNTESNKILSSHKLYLSEHLVNSLFSDLHYLNVFLLLIIFNIRQ